jgi:hypothetical protein
MAIIDDAHDLLPSERRELRGAADALIFAVAPGVDTSQALAEARAVRQALVDSRRWSRRRADALLATVRACGPQGLAVPMAGSEPVPSRSPRRGLWLRR